MQHLNYPLQLTFKVTTLSNDFIIADANEQTIAYVRQKMLKLVEEIHMLGLMLNLLLLLLFFFNIFDIATLSRLNSSNLS